MARTAAPLPAPLRWCGRTPPRRAGPADDSFRPCLLLAYRVAGGQAVAKTLPQDIDRLGALGAKVSAVAIIVLSLIPPPNLRRRPAEQASSLPQLAPRAKAGLGTHQILKTTPGEIMATAKPNVEDTRVSVWGKIIGGAAGFAFGGPLGALLGAVAGHAVDRYRARELTATMRRPANRLHHRRDRPGRQNGRPTAWSPATRSPPSARFPCARGRGAQCRAGLGFGPAKQRRFRSAKQIADLFAPKPGAGAITWQLVSHRPRRRPGAGQRAYLRQVAAIFALTTPLSNVSARCGAMSTRTIPIHPGCRTDGQRRGH